MDYPINLGFNTKSPTVLHIDLNSCFATVEQQANPLLRGKPIAVAAYNSPGAFILAPSIEAKMWGIKMGMSVRDAREIFPDLIVLEPDPWKYRNVHLALKALLSEYTDDVHPKSIDEFVLDLEGSPALPRGMLQIGAEIKKRIKDEIGEWLTVSIGISANRYLAKIGSGLHKPDGLDLIDATNHKEIFASLDLTDLTGIKKANAARLNRHGIFTVLDFYNATPMMLQQAFHAVTGYYWYSRLRGWETDDTPSRRRSYGNSVALGKKHVTPRELAPVLAHLVEKMSSRMRSGGYCARGVHLSLAYKHKGLTTNEKFSHHYSNYWHKGLTTNRLLFSAVEIYDVAYQLLCQAPHTLPVHIIAVTCFDLRTKGKYQLDLLNHTVKKRAMVQAQDKINDKWGDFVLKSARMLIAHSPVKDRIAFGGVKELDEVVSLLGVLLLQVVLHDLLCIMLLIPH
jgi:DNA polymerase IV